MKQFACTSCGNRVFFDNDVCLSCGRAIGFLPARLGFIAMKEGVGDRGSKAPARKGERAEWNYCANHSFGVCNWLVPAGDKSGLCPGCALNRTIPNLSEAGSVEGWQKLERAKKRLLYSLMRFGLGLGSAEEPGSRMQFDFMRNVTTGHADGVITIDIGEADAAAREKQREILNEPYRSLLGHMRHESGHFYWPIIVEKGGMLDRFRELYGDERQDYAAALARHHQSGPPADWSQRHISAYASAHPWEDWAETWAHYLHMVAVVDTAEAEGLEPRAAGILTGAPWPFARSDPYRERTFDALVKRWLPLTVAMNALSREMGQPDFYPFVIGSVVTEKLAFVHDAVRTKFARRSRSKVPTN